MEFIILSLIAGFILTLLVNGLTIMSFIFIFFITIILFFNYILFKGLLKKEKITLNHLNNIKIFLDRYKFNNKIIFGILLYYLGIISIMVFMIPTDPLILGLPVSELLPLYNITEPIVSLLMLSTPLTITFYLIIKFIIYKRLLNELNESIFHIVPLLILDSLYFPFLKSYK